MVRLEGSDHHFVSTTPDTAGVTRTTVFVILRGTELNSIWGKEDAAQKEVDRLNEAYPRGIRYKVVPMPIRR